MDLRQIKNLIKEFEESKLSSLELTDKDFSIKLEKVNNNGKFFSSNPSATHQASAVIPQVTVEASEAVVQEEVTTNKEVKAPLVGTYYASPSPDSEPYVKVGTKVNEGDTLFIVEAMKVMNEITAPVSGTIDKILVKDATMVEFGQVVMEIKE